MMGTKKTLLVFCILLTSPLLMAKSYQKIHSHNDYRQLVPFYQAYAQRVSSIEVDIFFRNDSILVAHDIIELDEAYTIEELYINPIVRLFEKNRNKAWADTEDSFILMIDIKSSTEPALGKISELLEKYPLVFNPDLNPYAVQVVITGNVPLPRDFHKYPSFIQFDGTLETEYNDEQLKRITMISLPFYKYARWNGTGTMSETDHENIQKAIDMAHKKNKPVRFWASPDEPTAWDKLSQMGVDYINTDHIEQCALFFKQSPR